MPSPQDSRTVAALTVSSQKERLTPQCSGAEYALTTTPCTTALYTATGGPNAFYDALGFPCVADGTVADGDTWPEFMTDCDSDDSAPTLDDYDDFKLDVFVYSPYVCL